LLRRKLAVAVEEADQHRRFSRQGVRAIRSRRRFDRSAAVCRHGRSSSCVLRAGKPSTDSTSGMPATDDARPSRDIAARSPAAEHSRWSRRAEHSCLCETSRHLVERNDWSRPLHGAVSAGERSAVREGVAVRSSVYGPTHLRGKGPRLTLTRLCGHRPPEDSPNSVTNQ
jgi:hypothetical protein